MSRARIGLRVLSSLGWQGGINYVVNWVRMSAGVPADERPELWLLPFDQRGVELAEPLRGLVAGIHPFSRAAELGLDMVFPATQIFEAPFGAPWAGWIPDWQCKHMPHLFDAMELARRDFHYGLLATRSPLLVLSSQMAVDDTKRLFGDRVVQNRKLPFGVIFDPDTLQAAARHGGGIRTEHRLGDKFFLVPNQWWKHKNHMVVLDAIERIADENFTVVFTGALKDHRWPDYPNSLLANLPLKTSQKIRVLGSVDRATQVALMLASTAIIQPSSFEGWSTVVEEAKALSHPLLLSDIPVHVEQAPATGRFFGVNDAGALATLMQESLRSARAADPRHEAAEEDAYRRHCVATLVSIATDTRAQYDPDRHDVAVVLAQATAAGMREGFFERHPGTFDKVASGSRAMLAASRDAVYRYEAALDSEPWSTRRTLLKSVAKPALANAPK